MPSGDMGRSSSCNFEYAEPQNNARRVNSLTAVLWHFFLASSKTFISEAFVIFRPMAEQLLTLAVLPLVLPYTVVASCAGTAMTAQRDITQTWAARSSVKNRPDGAIARALSHALALVTELPTSSPKYAFTRAMAERMLAENASLEHPLLAVNKTALARAFRRTLQLLETALRRQKGSTRLGQMIERYTWASLNEFGSIEGDKAEKLAQELLWVVEKMGECDGIDEVCWQWSRAHILASMSLTSTPRIQRSLVRLSAILCRAIGNDTVYVTNQVRFRFLLLWLPLFCRATHGGDGPIFSNWEKQETEEALQNAIAPLSAPDQELIFATWLEEYSWSISDWPNFQKSYGQWCQRARLQAVTKRLPIAA